MPLNGLKIILADYGLHPCQVTEKSKRATTLEFTTISAIIFKHCFPAIL